MRAVHARQQRNDLTCAVALHLAQVSCSAGAGSCVLTLLCLQWVERHKQQRDWIYSKSSDRVCLSVLLSRGVVFQG